MLEGTSVQDVNLLLLENFFDERQVFRGHVSAEVAGDATFMRKVQLSVRLINIKHFLVDLGKQLIQHLPQVGAFLVGLRVRVKDLRELGKVFQVGNELDVTKGVIVGHVSVKASRVGDEVLPLSLSYSCLESAFFEKLEVGVTIVSQEDHEESRSLVRNLVGDHPGACPRGF